MKVCYAKWLPTILEKTASNEITITTATATAAIKLFRWVNIFILKVTVQKTPYCRNLFLKMVDIGSNAAVRYIRIDFFFITKVNGCYDIGDRICQLVWLCHQKLNKMFTIKTQSKKTHRVHGIQYLKCDLKCSYSDDLKFHVEVPKGPTVAEKKSEKWEETEERKTNKRKPE